MASSERALLPIDIIEEIFCRIPVEYLTQFKLTCKQWHALLKDKRFIYKYLDLVQEQERFIRIDHMVQIIDPLNRALSSSPIPDEFQNITEISTILHCDGLLLFRCNNTRSTNCKLAVWNPFLTRTKWIEPMDFYSSNDVYGFGYDINVSREEYKILRIFDGEVENENEITPSSYREPQIQMYDFKSDSWRIIVDDASFDWSIDPPCKGVSVKGNMYWVAHLNKKPETFIQSFDFSTETFKQICDHLPFQCDVLDIAALSSFRGDRLSLLHQGGETMEIQVWVTNKLSDNEVVSWSKYLDVASPDLPRLHTDRDLAHPIYFISKNDSINVLCEEDTEDETDDVSVSVYEICKDGTIQKQVDTGRCDLQLHSNDRSFICSYVYIPSLVPVPE